MSNPARKSYSIRAMLFLLSLVVLAPTLLIQSYIYYDRFQGRRSREYQANLEVARAISRAFEAFVQGVLQQELVIGTTATASPQISASNLEHLLVQCAASSPAIGNFFLVGPRGHILASNSPASVGLDISDRSYFVQIIAGRAWVVSDLLHSEITGEPVFTISRSIRDGNGVLRGLVSASVVPERLDKVLPIERLGDAGISLIDGRGMLVYRHPDNPTGWEERNWRNHHPRIEEAFKGKDTTTTLTMRSSGKQRLFGFVPISTVGWVSAASRDEKDALAPIYSSLIQHAALFLVVILAAFGAALALARSIAVSIDRLRIHALAVGRGESTPPEAASGPFELKELADVFNRMAEKVSRREAALRESENRYRDLVQNANSAIIRIKNDGTIAFFNEYAQRFYGYSAEEAQGKPVSLILPRIDSTGADLSGLVDDIIAHPEQHRSHINENILRDGRRVWMAWTNRPICDEDGRVEEILSIGSDITELKRAEDARRETEERFRTVVHNLTEGLLIHARSGRVIYYNPASLSLYGFDGQWPELVDGEAASIWEITDLEGRIVPFQHWMHYEVLRGKKFQNVLAHVRRKDGGREFWGSFNGVPIYDQDGQVKFALITMRDESARIHAEEELRDINRKLEHIVQERTALLAKTIEELKRANQQLDARANQLAALTGELTMTEQRERKRLAQILHDGLQQHLAATKMQLGSIVATSPREDLCEELSEIEAKMDESIRMSRSLSADLSPPALHEGGLIAGLEWLARRMRERYAFQVDLVIGAHPELSEEVKILVFESVRELLFNAFKHARVDAAKVLLQPIDGAGIEIHVSDHGIGFDPARLVASGETGGGFGLFSIRERLGLIGGTLKIDSAPRKGSRFKLSLPYSSRVDAATAADISKPPECGMPASGTARDPIRVLLADDHTLFRDGIARLLGKETDIAVVGQAENGQEAVEMARRLNPQVILMDINMPQLNGIEATRIIHGESPSVRIIGLSMHEEEERAEAMQAAGAVGYKSKTCPVAELVAAVRGAMEP